MANLLQHVDSVNQPGGLPYLSNMLLWADSSASSFIGNGGSISTWSDQSAASNDAQNFSGTRTYATNVQNGHPGVYMNSNIAQVRFPTLLTDKTFTIIAVIKGGASPTGTYLTAWHDGSAANGRGFINLGGQMAYHDGTGYVYTPTGSIAANTCKLHAWRADGSIIQGALDSGAFTGSTDISSAVNPFATQFRLGDIGSPSGTDSVYDIYWLELIVTDDAISDAEWTEVRAYVNGKYSIW